MVSATDEIVKFIKKCTQQTKPFDNPDDKRKIVKNALDKRTGELKTKFKNLFGQDIDNLYLQWRDMQKSNRIATKDKGYQEKDFINDKQLLSIFKQLENFELLQLIVASSAMSEENVNALVSKTVKELYMDIRINENNVGYDPQEARNIWLSREVHNLNSEVHNLNSKVQGLNTQIENAKSEIKTLNGVTSVQKALIQRMRSGKNPELTTAEFKQLFPVKELRHRIIEKIKQDSTFTVQGHYHISFA